MPRHRVDTHDLAIQASAYRIITLLHTVYPEMTQAAHESALAAQGSLLGYLDSLIKGQELAVLTEELAKNAIMGSTITMINHICSLPEERLSSANKKLVFKQMVIIASTYPGMVWDSHHQQWSINQFYTKQGIKQLMTPPAEALNLVCRALLDDNRYELNSEHPTHDRIFRIEMFYIHLLDLQEQIEQGSLAKCATGLQHDLLFMLQDKYFDESKKPIHFPMIIADLMLESLSLFIKTQVNERTLLHWALWQTGEWKVGELCPLFLTLRENNPCLAINPDELWQERCKIYITERLETFGINPSSVNFEHYIAAIENAPIPLSEIPTIPFVIEIITMKDLPMQGDPLTPIAQLIMLRNQALCHFKDVIHRIDIHLPNVQKGIHDLLTALHCIFLLNRYQDEILFLFWEGDSDFIGVRISMSQLLTHFFKEYTPEKQLSTAFESLHSRYMTCEQEFLQSSHNSWVSNFFALAHDNQPLWEVACTQLEAWRSSAKAPHLLALNDAHLTAWRLESQSQSDEGLAVFNITPYVVNRLLLHGLVVPVREWTPLYCYYLNNVINWLFSHSFEQEDHVLATFEKSYPRNLLANLCFRAVIHHADLDPRLKRICLQEEVSIGDINRVPLFLNVLLGMEITNQERNLIVAISKDHKSAIGDGLFKLIRSNSNKMLIQDYRDLFNLFKWSLSDFSEEWRQQVLKALAPRLPTLLGDVFAIEDFFEGFSSEKLSEACRFEIFASPKLGMILRNGSDLAELFTFGFKHISEITQLQTLALLGPKLGEMIHHANELAVNLASLSVMNQLKILELLGPKLGAIIQNGAGLASLLGLSSTLLNEECRLLIWNAVAHKLDTLIQDGEQLNCLLALPLQQLNHGRRLAILTALIPILGTKIQNVGQLVNLFSHSLEASSICSHLLILALLAPKLGAMIENGAELASLLKLSLECLNEECRIVIWSAVALRLDIIIKDGAQLDSLLVLPLEKLNQMRRLEILAALKPTLGTKIQNISQLANLLSLSPEYLNDAWRLEILKAIEPPKIETLIKNRRHLSELLFKISSEPYNDVCRSQLLATIKFEEIIKFGHHLEEFFSLLPECLNEEWRSHILASLKLGDIIEDRAELDELFKLSKEQLNDTQRALVLESVKTKDWFLPRRSAAFFSAGELGAHAREESQQKTTFSKKP